MEKNKIIINGITLTKGTEAKATVKDGSIIITFKKKESDVKQPKFKKGDVIYVEDKYGYNLAIIERQEDDFIFVSGYLDINTNKTYLSLNDGILFYLKKNIKSVRHATEEEIAKFNKEFSEQKQLRWDEKELKFKEYRWRAGINIKYWYITEVWTIASSLDLHDDMDNNFYDTRNYFQTEELAKKALAKLVVNMLFKN